ncbi:MAG TPA: hypothetical protein PL029_04145 [Bacteroidia bacterium]|nr:hypothetical protein [Bacteroidia bacterium]
MNIALAIEYIPRRMKDLGVGDNYYLRFRHFVLEGNQTLELDAHNQFFLLIDDNSDLSISSDFGFYDITYPNTNEQTYEHQGLITITNYSSTLNHVRFIQIIPKN